MELKHAATLKISLLGPPQVSWHDETFSLPRKQARALLYLLAASRKPTSKDSLLALFWPETDDATARKNLSRLISYMRHQLPEREIVLIENASVSLNRHLVWSDVVDFSALCKSDDLNTMKTAVKLYRGHFLTGFSLKNNLEYERWQSQNQRSCERLYLSILSRLVIAMRQNGDYQAAIRYAQNYMETDDLSEEIHRELIGLYALAGNRAAALKQYELCVEALERELGVSPLPETYNAFELVLHGLTGRSTPAVADEVMSRWVLRPALDLPLIGRETAWHELESAYQQMHSGGVVLIAGEAGIGKTRLIQEFVTKENRTVLTGNSHANTQTLPYYPLVQALRQAIKYPGMLANIPLIWLGEIEQILPELSTLYSNLPSSKIVDQGQAQARLLEAITQVFFGLARHASSFLLCLDDLHWADDSTLSWLTYISPRLADSGLCIIGAYRWEEREQIQNVRHMFRRVKLLAEITLSGLSTEDVRHVLGQTTHDLPDRIDFARRIRQITGGNAFFVLETIRTLLESGSLNRIPENIPLPGSVQEAITDRLVLLSPLARQILETATILFPDLDLDLLEQTAGKAEFETVDALDELISRHILKEKAGSLEFHHELLRMAVYQSLTPWRRKLLHRRAGNALGDKYAGREEKVAAQMAHHFDSAMSYDRAVDYYGKAAQAAQAVYAYREALKHVQRALALLPKVENNPAQAARLYQLLAQNLDHLGRYEDARDALQQAILNCHPSDSFHLAELHHQIAGTHIAQLNYPEANEGLAESLSHLVNPLAKRNEQWWRLWLDIKLDYLTLSSYHMDGQRSQTLISEIEPVIERSGTKNQRRYYANRIFIARMVMERYQPSEETIAFTKLELDLAQKSQNPISVNYAEFYMGFCLLFANQLVSSEKWLLKALNSARDINFRVMEARCLAFLTTLYRRQGDLMRTEKYARETEVAGKLVGSLHYQAHSLANLAWIAYKNGHGDQVLDTAVTACEYFVSSAVPFAWIGYMTLLAITLDSQQLESAVKAARALLDPYQQRLPDELTTALSRAVGSWDRQDERSAKKLLEQAVNLAQSGGFL